MSGELQKQKILIIDDAIIYINVLGAALKSDYKILFSLDGQEGVQSAVVYQPDLILLDILMPGMDGYETCRLLKADVRTRDIPVIFLTARSGDEDEAKGFELGAVDYITKPFSPPKLLARVKTHTALRRARLDLQEWNRDLKRANSNLENANAQLAGIIESMADIVWEVDLSGSFTYCSPHVQEVLGYTSEEMVGKTPFDFMPPDETAKIRAACNKIWKQRDRITDLENWNIHKDGRMVLLSTTGVPIIDNNGRLAGYRGVEKDITSLRKYEVELLKLSRAVEQSPVITVITDINGTIEFANPKFTELTGYTAEEAIGQNPRFLKSGNTPEKNHKDLWIAITSGKTWEGEFHNKSKDGSLFWEHAKISPLRDATGTITHFLAVKEDITEKKSIIEQLVVAKEQAEAATRAKSEFLAIMSHEIRTPMNGVIGMSSILLETDLSAEQREYAEIVSRSGENLLGLINDILDFSKIESGKLDLEMIDFDLHLILDDSTRLLAYRADEVDLALTCNIETAVPLFLRGDPGRIRQIVTNLVGNALKFTHQGAVGINVSLASDHDGFVTIRFAITDTGIGIPESRLSALFTPFTQADASTTRKYGGTGLGLAICKQLAELMGGGIGVTSGEGIGSTFWFTARLEKQSAEVLKTSQAEAAQMRAVTPRIPEKIDDMTARILLAEDNVINQKVAQHILKKLGYSVDVVADGQQAVEALEKINYDLVLMDCMMPKLNGFEATVIIRDQSTEVLNHGVPIIAMTANAMKEDRDKCLEAGMDDYVSKPVKKDVLADIIAKWLTPTHPLRRKTIDVGSQDLARLKRLTVLYVEDDDETRHQYSQFLTRMVGTLVTAKDGAEGLAAYYLHKPDVIITDITMPVMDGLEMLKRARTTNASLPAIVLSAFELSDYQHDLGVLRHESKPVSGTKLKIALLECVESLTL